jgi:hypothetical protein
VAVEITAFKLNAQKIAPDTNTVSPLQVSGRIGSAAAPIRASSTTRATWCSSRWRPKAGSK